jgi:hypothetical protein
LAETLEAQLERVQAAIAAIESGAQDYTIGQRRFTRANLETLYRREADLLRRIDRAKHGTRTYAAFSE